MTERTRIIGHAAFSARMGWASPDVSRAMSSLATRRRREGASRPGDMPAPDGREKRGSNFVPWWYESTVAEWDATRPFTIHDARNLPDGFKVCSRCGETKPVAEYNTYVPRKGVRRIMAKCKTCQSEAALIWNRSNPERAAAATAKWHRKTKRRDRARRYGLTESELDAMELAQQGVCLICEEPAEVLYVDHDHKRGHVRGLLCILCNTGLGAFHDDPERLLRAIHYLRTTTDGVFAPADRDGPGRVA